MNIDQSRLKKSQRILCGVVEVLVSLGASTTITRAWLGHIDGYMAIIVILFIVIALILEAKSRALIGFCLWCGILTPQIIRWFEGEEDE